jgi:hypothetical protein
VANKSANTYADCQRSPANANGDKTAKTRCFHRVFERFRMSAKGSLVPRKGLEPSRLSALLPESSASTNSAIWAVGGVMAASGRDVNGRMRGGGGRALTVVGRPVAMYGGDAGRAVSSGDIRSILGQ